MRTPTRTYWTYPEVGNEEIDLTSKVIRSGFLSYGKICRQFEDEIANYIGCNHAIVVNNGTSAIMATLIALQLPRRSYVLVPDYTFAATANAVIASGLRPILVDVDETYNISVPKLESTIEACKDLPIAALIAVDVAGMPADLGSLRKLCDDHGLYLIEDAAEAFGSIYQQKKVGSICSDAITFSFHSSKIICTGEGGAITTNDDDLAEKLRYVVRQGFLGGVHYDHVAYGLNFKMTDLQAAVGLIQLGKAEKFIRNRNQIARFYKGELPRTIRSQRIPPYASRSTYWIYQAILPDEELRNHVLQEMSQNGIDVKVCWKPLHQQPHLKEYGSSQNLEHSDYLAARTISLPTGNVMPKEHAKYIVDKMSEVLEKRTNSKILL